VALDGESADGLEHDVLAVAPLVAASGRLLGLVAIHEMPFMAFQAESLKGLAAVTALLADMLEDHVVGARDEDALLLSLAPGSAAAAPSSETRALARERDGGELATEAWLEHELAAGQAAGEA